MASLTPHFAQLDPVDIDRLFQHAPQPVPLDAEPQLRALSLGATLYTPGSRPDLIADIGKAHDAGARSQVLCLEDAIADREVPAAEANVIDALRALGSQGAPGSQGALGSQGAPGSQGALSAGGSTNALGHQLFVRVRNAEQMTRIVGELGEDADALTGFVLPKFREGNGLEYLDALADASAALGRTLWAMPVLESREFIYRELRTDALIGLRRILDKHRDIVLALRIGATDLSALYGLRRRPDVTLWDVAVVASAIGDIVNVFARAPEPEAPSEMVITGPVWEYFSSPPRLLRTQLRSTPFAEQSDVRAELMAADEDGLIREAVLDRVNGLIGKTVIHPSHIHPVHALYAVTDEEHSDARDIVAAHDAGGGVRRSTARNKMNEAGPHYHWALRTLMLARIFGVTRPGVTYVDLLAAGRRAA